MRILVYGFGPYRQFRKNITARIVKSLAISPKLATEIFPVRFQRRQFTAALNRHRPDIVLGLGQSTRSHIDLESQAHNRKRASKSAELRPICKNRPRVLSTTLKIGTGRVLRMSNDAGDYVCNYSMYVMLDAIARKRSRTRFGFIHIPHDWNLNQAVQLVRRVLRQCRRAS
jgi:pyrrolidone-carboxylate peptidase